MAKDKIAIPGSLLRIIHYLLSAVCFFFIFLLAVTLTPNRIDVNLILTMIIGVLLIAFMLHVNKLLTEIYKQLVALTEKAVSSSAANEEQ